MKVKNTYLHRRSQAFYHIFLFVIFVLGTVTASAQTISMGIVSNRDTAAEDGSPDARIRFDLVNGTFNTNYILIFSFSGIAQNGVDIPDLNAASLELTPNILGEATLTVDIEAIQDNLIEGDEELIITLEDGAYTADPLNNQVTLIIQDDDEGLVTIVATDDDASEAGPDSGLFTVDLGGVNNTAGPITVNYGIGGISTAIVSDYEPLPFSLDIGIGEQTGTIELIPVDDALIEPEEVLRINLIQTSEPALFPIADAGVVSVGVNRDDVLIQSDDIAGFTFVEVGGTTVTGEDGTNQTFTVVLDAEPTSDVVIDVASSDITEGDVDLPSLTFSPTNYDTPQTVTVIGQDDPLVDGDQNYDIVLSIRAAASDDDFDAVPDQIINAINLDDENFEANVIATVDTATEAGTIPGTFAFSLSETNNTGGPIAITYTVSGTATPTDDYVPLTGTVSIPDGLDVVEVDVVPVDDSLVEDDETVIVTLQAGAVYTVGGNDQDAITIESDDVDALVIDDVSIAEGNSGTRNLVFTVSLVDGVAASDDIGFDFATSPGSASVTASDFIANTGTGTILQGNLSTTITVIINGDTDIETDEDFSVVLSNPVNAIIADATGVGTIVNDDFNSISIANLSRNEGDAGTTIFNFEVSIDGGAAALQDIQFTYSTANITATAADYVAVTGASGTITAGNSSTLVAILVNGDVQLEADESFEVRISNPVNAILGTAEAVGTIQNDDSASVQIADVSVNEDDGSVTMVAILDNPVAGGFRVRVSTNDGTATLANDDYTPINSRLLVFTGTAGEIENFSFTPTADIIIEPDETVSISMDNLTNTSLPVNIGDTATATILNDDSCASGTAAPVLNTAQSRFFCDDFSVDLDAFTVSAVPVGAQLVWSDTDTDVTNVNTHLATSVVNQAGTYFGFFYDSANTCASAILEVTLVGNQTPSAGTGANAAACNTVGNGGPTSIDLDNQITGADAGVWTVLSTPAGGNVIIGTGNNVDFNGTAAGDYIFRYTTLGAVAPCTEDTTDITVTISDCSVNCDAGDTAPIINDTLPTNFCDSIEVDLNEYVTNNAPTGSVLTWSTSSNPLQVSAHRSNVVTSPGTYFGFFFDDADNVNILDCSSPVVSITLVLNTSPSIVETNGGVGCELGSVDLTARGTVGATLNWYDSPTSDVILGVGATFTTPEISETTTFYVEASANGCTSERAAVVATVNNNPSTGTVNTVFGCNEVPEGESTVLDLDNALTGADAGFWEIVDDPSGQVVINANNEVDFAGLAEGNYVFRYTTNVAEAPCTDQSIEVAVAVVDCLLDADNDGLNDDAEEALGTDPQNPDTDGDGILDGQEVNVDATDPLDDCDSLGGTALPDSDCDNDGLTNAEEMDLGTNPELADTDQDGLTDGEEVLGEDDSTTPLIPEGLSDPLDPCDPTISENCNAAPTDLEVLKSANRAAALPNDEVIFTVTVRNIGENPAINISVQDETVLVPTNGVATATGFDVINTEPSIGVFTASTGLWSIPELLPEAEAVLEITVRVNELGDLTNTASLASSVPTDIETENNSASVTVRVRESDCIAPGTICNLFSPNGDGVNDFLILVDHLNYPNNLLQVYDRYGNEVFRQSAYDSTWDGRGKNGNLPKGTYFYILDLGDGTEVTKGWIQIIRQ